MKHVRRAKPEDAKGIHEVHMRSIQEVCSKDHSDEEIKAWGFRPFREDWRLNAINNQYVWVVENGGLIEGFGHFGLEKREDDSVAHIYGLYFAPEALGQGFGKQILNEMVHMVKELGASSIFLESTISAHEFYKKFGFKDLGPQSSIAIGGIQIRCFPMMMKLES